MKWQEIFDNIKHPIKDEFMDWLRDNGYFIHRPTYETINDWVRKQDIKTIYGWIVAFAETKESHIEMMYSGYHKIYTAIIKFDNSEKSYHNNQASRTLEEEMFWCASKFFKVM